MGNFYAHITLVAQLLRAIVLAIRSDGSIATNAIGHNRALTTVYMTDSPRRDICAPFAIDVESDYRRLLAQGSRADVADLNLQPHVDQVQAGAFG